MAAVSDDDDGVKNKELPGIEFKKSRRTKSLTGTSLASIESLSMPLVQEVVLSADIRCSECQKRVADMMSKLNESVLVNVSEKKVTLTSRYPVVVEVSKRQITAVRRNPLQKIAIIKRIFGSSSR
ncbi:hypothetical protein KPL70_012573 [Citrus sinensis]|uniref:uncharacterized protein LOC102630781 isoform X2 n=1 Tax=Citrus sinensis TaxID=2711 RepID=UPI0003D750AA|nr:uncharacterized protein LOC102630781 isoform X2 [Citrus sinensis]XP_024042359.1 uncharacterized protein LOC18043525 isoform X2 [Citrus x clementina]KAH9707436.1 hypothetical protein KPL70_012573 [Citrus sinensis]